MPYLYRRKSDLIDLMIEKVFTKEVVLADGASEGGDYIVVLDGYEFRESDPTPGSDTTATIASNLASSINGSGLAISASASGGVVTLTPDKRGVDFSIETKTTDANGKIYHRTAEPHSYQVKNAANWDGSFSTMETVPAKGKASTSAGVDPTPNGMMLDKYTRFRFSPSDYSIADDDVLFFRIAPVYDSGADPDGRIVIVLTPEQMTENHTALVLQGAVPIAADSDSATEFIMPAQTTSLVVRNIDSTEDVWLSFGTGDAEIPLSTGETFRDNKYGSGDIRIRTDAAAGGPADVYIYVTVNTSRIL